MPLEEWEEQIHLPRQSGGTLKRMVHLSAYFDLARTYLKFSFTVCKAAARYPDFQNPNVSVTSKATIVLKNSIFCKISEFFRRTRRSDFGGQGGRQIGLPHLMCRLSAPHEQSHLIS